MHNDNDQDADGAHHLTTNQEEDETTHYIIHTHNDDVSPTTPSHIEIEIVNPKPSNEYWYSVTVTSYEKYTGSAMNMGEADLILPGRTTKSLLYFWKPLFQAEYSVTVHELPILVTGNKPTLPLSPPIMNVIIENKPGISSWPIERDRLHSMPPCSTVNRRGLYNNRQGLYTTWDGEWIGPRVYSGIGALRTGWYFIPGIGMQMGCKIEIYNDVDLMNVPTVLMRQHHDDDDNSQKPEQTQQQHKSIYILGTSKERGVFLSLVDMLLNREEKKYLDDSVISKCWGRASVRKYNLHIVYQDWRSNYFENEEDEPNVLCHDDVVVREGGSLLMQNGLKVFREEVFREGNEAEWPSVILMTSSGNIGFRGDYDIKRFISSIPPAWQGTILLTDGAFSALHAGRGDRFNYRDYRQKLRDLTNNIPDHRIQWVDGLGISRNQRLYSELGPNHVSASQHFHKQCNVDYEGTDHIIRRMRICSNITEIMAQLLLNYALGPKSRFVESVEKEKSNNNVVKANNDEINTMVYCHACPGGLLPFHITPFPNMTCVTGNLHSRSQNEVSNTGPETCPMGCLDLDIQQYVPTQSGFVHERLCPMNIFQPAPVQTRKIEAEEMRYDSEGDWLNLWTMTFIFMVVTIYRKPIGLRLRKQRLPPMPSIEE